MRGPIRREEAGGSVRPRAILYRYIARELSGPTCLALGALAAVVLTRDLPGYADLLINRGATPARVGGIVLYQSLGLVGQMLPFATLVGSLSGLGRLVTDLEVMVLSALGVDPRALIAPVAAFAGAMACLAFSMNLLVSPWAQRELNRVMGELAKVNPVAAVEPGVVHRIGDWKLEARRVSHRGTAVLEGVLLWMPSIGDTIFSRTARISDGATGAPEIVLEHGVLLRSTRARLTAMRFDEMRTAIPQSRGSTDLPFEDRLKSRSTSSLWSLAREASIASPRWAVESELQRRFALPVATALLGLLALPLALTRRRASRSIGVVIGLGITIAYYGLVQAAEGIARWAPGSAALVTWLPNGALVVLLAVLVRRSSRTGDPDERAARRGSKRTDGPGPREPSVTVVRVRRWALGRYVAARFAGLAGLCFAALVIGYLLVDVLERLQWFARHAATSDEIVRFYSARIPLLISRVVPMGLVLAMALTVGLLTSTGELLGMRTLGISSLQVLRPALILCLLATPLSFLLNDQIVPYTNALADLIKQRDITEVASRPAAVWGVHKDTIYQLESLDANQGAAEDAIVYPLGRDGLPIGRIDARSMLHVGRGHWRLRDATGAQFDESGQLRSVAPPRNADLGDQPSSRLDLMHLSVAEIASLIRELADRGESTTELEVDLNLKLATPFACLLLPALVMVLASTGPPFPSSALTLILACVIAVAYTLLAGAFASFGRGAVLAPWIGGWGASMVMLAGLIGLVWRSQAARRKH